MTSKNSSRSARIIAATLVAFGITYSCVERPKGEVDPPDPTRTLALEGTIACVVKQADEFKIAAEALVSAIEAWQQDPEDDEALGHAQQAWDAAMGSWQNLELMQVGPAGKSGDIEQGGVVGGQDLRDEIYSFPLINACRVDQGLVAKVYEGDLASEPVNARGLDAIEYLLFETGTESACPTTATIISSGSWSMVEDLSQRRADYAKDAAEEVLLLAEQLVSAWSTDGDNFQAAVIDAGNSGPYENQAAALNAVIDGLFYIEKIVKDVKLAVPLGISPTCPESFCPQSLEHRSALRSKESISDNVAGFRAMLEGCGSGDSIGLLELLAEEGSQRLAAELLTALENVEKALAAIEEPDLAEALETDPGSVEALYDALKALTDLLKLDVVEVLNLKLPSSVSGDND